MYGAAHATASGLFAPGALTAEYSGRKESAYMLETKRFTTLDVRPVAHSRNKAKARRVEQQTQLNLIDMMVGDDSLLTGRVV